MWILETVGYTTPHYILLNNWIQQVAIPEFTNVKHSQGKACYVCTAWHTLLTDATNITSLLQEYAIFGGLIRGSLVVLEGKEEEKEYYDILILE